MLNDFLDFNYSRRAVQIKRPTETCDPSILLIATFRIEFCEFETEYEYENDFFLP